MSRDGRDEEPPRVTDSPVIPRIMQEDSVVGKYDEGFGASLSQERDVPVGYSNEPLLHHDDPPAAREMDGVEQVL